MKSCVAKNYKSFYSGFPQKIKRGWTDQIFSEYIRDRAGWRCQNKRCGKRFDKNNGKEKRKLHCCHLGYGRAHIQTRWNEFNCLALCNGCHLRVDQHPLRALKILHENFTLEQVLYVRDQYKVDIGMKQKEFELIERERIKKLIKELNNE